MSENLNLNENFAMVVHLLLKNWEHQLEKINIFFYENFSFSDIVTSPLSCWPTWKKTSRLPLWRCAYHSGVWPRRRLWRSWDRVSIQRWSSYWSPLMLWWSLNQERNCGVELLMTVTLSARAGLPRSRCKTWLRCSQDRGQPEDWSGELSLVRDND